MRTHWEQQKNPKTLLLPSPPTKKKNKIGPFECRLLHLIGCQEFLFLGLSRVLALSGPYMFVYNSKKLGVFCIAMHYE